MGKMKKRAGKKGLAGMVWPEPTGPLHSGVFDLGNGWSATVPAPLCEETKDGDMVLWREAFLIQISSHGSSGWSDSREKRYSELSGLVGESSFKVARNRNEDPMALIAFWLVPEGREDERIGLQAYALTDSHSLIIRIIFEAPEGPEWALAFVDSIRYSAAFAR